MKIIESSSLIDAWKRALEAIKHAGTGITDEKKNLIEFLNLFLIISNPNDAKDIKAINPEMHAWMKVNFEEKIRVPELGNAKSYGFRLRDYNGKDQLKWVIDKLARKRETKSATITTLMPLEDEIYIPCVSLLDFKIRDGILIFSVTCRSLDFGKKALFNLSALATIGDEIMKDCGVNDLTLNVHVISAHVYEDDIDILEKMDA